MAFKIKNLVINDLLFLAPMAGVTNLAYRKMCKKYGAGVVVSEMISDKGIFYQDEKTLQLMKIDDNEHIVGIQIFGGDIETLIYAAKYVEKNTKADFIDINMGCPVAKILKAKSGSSYLLDVERIYITVKAVVESVNIPVTVKIRIGWDQESINAIEVAKVIKKAGASAITVHGRTKNQMYAGEVNYEIIKKIKEELGYFPVIANGDINTPEKAKFVLDYCKCDALMIGRGSYGHPQIFKQINEFLSIGTYRETTILEKISELKEYASNLIELKGEKIAIKELRGQSTWFIKKIPNSAIIRSKLIGINNFKDLLAILDDIF